MIKRIIDIILSSITIIVLSPLLIPVVIILKTTGERYIFYKQKRVGKNENIFELLKFATMFKNSPNMSGGNITSKDDIRILPFVNRNQPRLNFARGSLGAFFSSFSDIFQPLSKSPFNPLFTCSSKYWPIRIT